MAAIIQVSIGSTVAVVGIAAIAYSIGVDKVLRHPLRNLELLIASVVLSRLPKPVKRRMYRGRRRSK